MLSSSYIYINDASSWQQSGMQLPIAPTECLQLHSTLRFLGRTYHFDSRPKAVLSAVQSALAAQLPPITSTQEANILVSLALLRTSPRPSSARLRDFTSLGAAGHGSWEDAWSLRSKASLIHHGAPPRGPKSEDFRRKYHRCWSRNTKVLHLRSKRSAP